MIIDFHTHTFPEKIADATVEHLSRTAHIAPQTHARSAELQASMKEAGIDVSVVLPVATSVKQVEKLNSFAAGMNEHFPESGLLYFGCIHPEFPGYREELARVKELGLKGIKIHPVYQDVDLDDIRFLRILERAAELGLIVITHAGLDIGYPGLVRCSPVMCRHVVDEIGPFPFIAAHMGGWRNWDIVPEVLGGTGIYLDTGFSLGRITPLADGYWDGRDKNLMSPDEFLTLIRNIGADRVLFGTDSPWVSQKEMIGQLMDIPFTEEEKNAVLGENAAKLLGLS